MHFDNEFAMRARRHPEYYTVQQYTGVKDRNGREIYEGDIIEYTPFNQQDYRGTRSKVPTLESFHWFSELADMLEMDASCDIQVIGNIFENPELLNEKTN